MKNFQLSTIKLPREFSVCPPVRSMANLSNHGFIKEQAILGLQICVRIHGTIEKAKLKIGDKSYEAGFPHLLIKRHGEIHRTPVAGKSDSFYFTYDTDNAPKIPDDLVMSEIRLTPTINSLIRQATNLALHSVDFGVFDRIDALCMQLLTELMLESNHRVARTEDEAKIQRVASYLQMHFTEDISFDEVAKHFHYSPRSFYRHWWKFFDRSPGEFVSDLKLTEAKRLLTETESSVEEISQMLNYNSSAYFINFFRKHIRMTPLQYRKHLFQSFR